MLYFKIWQKIGYNQFQIFHVFFTINSCKAEYLILSTAKLVTWSWLLFSGIDHLVEVLDKLSTTSVVFFGSERELQYMHLYGV